MGACGSVKNILYLGSQSASRQKLLRDAGIEFQVVPQNSDEQVDARELDFFGHVLAIAQHKMQHILLPLPQDVGQDFLFVLTADSLVRTVHSNEVFGKPRDYEHAKQMLRTMYGHQIEVATGCCVEKRRWDGHHWAVESYKHWVTDALVEFWVAEHELDDYCNRHPQVLTSAGAGILEGSGQVYFKSLHGSYTAALGLPLYQVQQALHDLGFFL